MFRKRFLKLQNNLTQQKLTAVLICDTANIAYFTGYDNFSYLEREAYLLIGQNFQYIITDARYSEAVRKQIPHFLLYERSVTNPTVKLFAKLQSQIQTLGIEENELTVSEYKLLKKHFKYLKAFQTHQLRSIKDLEEISNIEISCKLGDLAFNYIVKKIKIGISEKEVAALLEKFIKEKGGEFSFPAIIAFGKNSSIPHHQTGQSKLQKGEVILLDFGVKFKNYCSDMTRTIFLGKPDKKQQLIYQTVLTAQNKAVEYITRLKKSGKTIKAQEVDKIARAYIKSQGFGDIPHSLGHGIGLQVHEHPSLSVGSREHLAEGMVFSIEPGIYIPGFGGVRIEDLYVLEKTQLRALTNSPK